MIAEPASRTLEAGAWAAVLTAEGRGAIAAVRVWGSSALRLADLAFRPLHGPSLGRSRSGHLRLGRIGAGLGDEVVAYRTDDDPPEVEIQCHGGPAAVALVLDALAERGVRIVPAERWVGRRAVARVTAEAAIDLARTSTVPTAEILRDQADGALERDIRRILDGLDGKADDAALALDRLIERARLGVRLISGWRVVLAGRPNVGKSRLLNAMAGYERAIVDATPGTTRDVVTVQTAIAGWPVELADTAGLRITTDPIEAAGVALARSRQLAADLVLLVLDRSKPIIAGDWELLAAFPAALRVASKADLPAEWDESTIGAQAVSALRGDGLKELIDEIGRRLVPSPPPNGVGVPFREEHAQALRRARILLAGGRPAAARLALGRLLQPPREVGLTERSG